MTSRYDRGISPHGPREQLLALGLSEEFVDGSIEVLSIASSLKDLREEFNKRHLSCDKEQFLLPVFRPIYQTNPQVKEGVLQALAAHGIDIGLADRYLTEMTDQPYLYIRIAHEGEFDRETVDTLVDTTQQVMFDTVRTFLGFTKPPQT